MSATARSPASRWRRRTDLGLRRRRRSSTEGLPSESFPIGFGRPFHDRSWLAALEINVRAELGTLIADMRRLRRHVRLVPGADAGVGAVLRDTLLSDRSHSVDRD